ncbi:MAG: hypothetical protein KGM24_15065, partial [Elusimicrobia bacterium]|nr:hypothetical protein [Elusimicrobiota bacterium]
MSAAFAVLAALLIARSRGFLGYLLGPGVLDGTSARLVLSYAAWPVLLAAALWLTAWGLGRRLLRGLGAAPAAPLDEIAAAAAGLGLLGTAVFALGAAGLL